MKVSEFNITNYDFKGKFESDWIELEVNGVKFQIIQRNDLIEIKTIDGRLAVFPETANNVLVGAVKHDFTSSEISR